MLLTGYKFYFKRKKLQTNIVLSDRGKYPDGNLLWNVSKIKMDLILKEWQDE